MCFELGERATQSREWSALNMSVPPRAPAGCSGPRRAPARGPSAGPQRRAPAALVATDVHHHHVSQTLDFIFKTLLTSFFACLKMKYPIEK